jgi:hypothetical protein
LREIRDIANFDEPITLSGKMSKHAMNLWIRSIYTRQIDIMEIIPTEMIDLLNHIDQYLLGQEQAQGCDDFLTITTIESDIIRYYDTNALYMDNKLLNFLKELSRRYKLKRLYLWIHNKK